jgi:hypothetical protein
MKFDLQGIRCKADWITDTLGEPKGPFEKRVEHVARASASLVHGAYLEAVRPLIRKRANIVSLFFSPSALTADGEIVRNEPPYGPEVKRVLALIDGDLAELRADRDRALVELGVLPAAPRPQLPGPGPVWPAAACRSYPTASRAAPRCGPT